MITKRDLPVQSGKPLVRSLRASVRRFELRYEMSSEDMVVAVKAGAMRETGEISKWLQHYQVFKRLTGMGGTHLTTTAASTKTG